MPIPALPSIFEAVGDSVYRHSDAEVAKRKAGSVANLKANHAGRTR